jgi:hypothetical protein
VKSSFAVLLSAAAIVLLVGCGGEKAAEPAGRTAAPAAEAARPAAKGAPYDCRDFSLTLAEGWEASPLNMGMVNVLPKGKVSPGLYFKFEGDGNAVGTAEASIQSMISGYGGSPMESTTIAGVEFKTTTYSYSGMTQTMHVAFRDGTKITITIEGAGGKDNADIKAMLATLSLK